MFTQLIFKWFNIILGYSFKMYLQNFFYWITKGIVSSNILLFFRSPTSYVR